MPYALFCNEAKLSKAYPAEADVWKEARKSGLVVDAVSQGETAAPRPVLENDYEIRPCRPDPDENPAKPRAWLWPARPARKPAPRTLSCGASRGSRR